MKDNEKKIWDTINQLLNDIPRQAECSHCGDRFHGHGVYCSDCTMKISEHETSSPHAGERD